MCTAGDLTAVAQPGSNNMGDPYVTWTLPDGSIRPGCPDPNDPTAIPNATVFENVNGTGVNVEVPIDYSI